jgi:Protein of unknown function (DUF3489)
VAAAGHFDWTLSAKEALLSVRRRSGGSPAPASDTVMPGLWVVGSRVLARPEPEDHPMTKQSRSKTRDRKPVRAPAHVTPANVTPADAVSRDAPAPVPGRPGGKLGLIVDQLGTKAGATIADLAAITGWQTHTVHAALSRLRRRGFAARLESERKVYRLVGREG